MYFLGQRPKMSSQKTPQKGTCTPNPTACNTTYIPAPMFTCPIVHTCSCAHYTDMHIQACMHVHTYTHMLTCHCAQSCHCTALPGCPPPTKPALPPTLYVQSCENSTTLKVNKAHLLKIAPVSMVTPATQNLFIN